MELKDFIKSVIVEISHGVLMAKKELEGTNTLINPATTKGVILKDGGTERSVQNIEFDISVSVSEQTENAKNKDKKGNANIKVVDVFNLSLGKEIVETDSSSYKNATINRIKFSVPISFSTNTQTQSNKTKITGSVVTFS